MIFSAKGIGSQFQPTFAKAFGGRKSGFPYEFRGDTMVILSDFSGQHKNSHFETYSFLFLDPHQNSDWFSKQVQFRANGSLENRRMSFKSMNDIKRRDALLPFLSMANFVEGCLVTFAISKNGQSLFASGLEPRGEDILSSWKLKTREHVMRIVHLGAYLAAAFSRPMQNLIWIIDEDDAQGRWRERPDPPP